MRDADDDVRARSGESGRHDTGAYRVERSEIAVDNGKWADYHTVAQDRLLVQHGNVGAGRGFFRANPVRAATEVTREKEVPMCQECGCSPCEVCGREIEDGVCSGCGEPAEECLCEPLEDE